MRIVDTFEAIAADIVIIKTNYVNKFRFTNKWSALNWWWIYFRIVKDFVSYFFNELNIELKLDIEIWGMILRDAQLRPTTGWQQTEIILNSPFARVVFHCIEWSFFRFWTGSFFNKKFSDFFAFFSSLLITVNELLSFMILFRSNIVLFKRFWKWRTGAVSCPWRHPREFRGRWEQIQNVEDPISLVTRGNHNTQPTKSRLFLQKHFKIKFSKIRLAILKIFQNFGKRFSVFHHLNKQLIAKKIPCQWTADLESKWRI